MIHSYIPRSLEGHTFSLGDSVYHIEDFGGPRDGDTVTRWDNGSSSPSAFGTLSEASRSGEVFTVSITFP